MIIDRDVVRKSYVPFALLIVELILALFVVFEFLAIIGFSFDPATRALSFGLSSNPLEYFFFFLVLGLLYYVFHHGQRKFEVVFVATKLFPFAVKSNVSHKLWLAKNEPRAAALLLIEFAFVMSVALTIYAYLDPDFAIINWEKFGIYPPLTTLLNIIIFILVVAAFYYLYRFTEPYRKATKKK